MSPDPRERQRNIEKLLLEFHSAPGKFAVARREPALLFASVREVLLLASGRGIEEQAPPPGAQARMAACFFVRAAMLQPDADHYGLLGLPRNVEPAALKDRYRQMMRLLHPDFSAGTHWPRDAATRVNRAYDVLASPEQRRAYDEKLGAHPRPPPGPEHQRTTAIQRKLADNEPYRQGGRRLLKNLALACGGAGAVAGIGWVLATGTENESLVQRERRAAPAAAPVTLASTQAVATSPLPAAAIVAMTETPAPPTASQELAARAESLLSSIAPLRAQPAPATAAFEPKAEVTRVEVADAALARRALPESAAQAMASQASMSQVVPAVAATAAAAPAVASAPTAATLPSPAVAQAVTPISAATATAAAAALQTAPASVVPTPFQSPAARAPQYAGPNMADVQPFLTRLVREMESGWGDHVLSVLDRPARATPGAQAVLAQFNEIVDGRRPVKVSNVEFHGRPRENRLVVTGRLNLQPRDAQGGPREFLVEAEFVRQDGEVTMTRLGRAAP